MSDRYNTLRTVKNHVVREAMTAAGFKSRLAFAKAAGIQPNEACLMAAGAYPVFTEQGEARDAARRASETLCIPVEQLGTAPPIEPTQGRFATLVIKNNQQASNDDIFAAYLAAVDMAKRYQAEILKPAI